MEAEGRSLRRGVMRAGAGLACLAVAGLFVFVGLGFCLWAIYTSIADQIGEPGASLLLGVSMLVLAGIFVWTAIRLSR